MLVADSTRPARFPARSKGGVHLLALSPKCRWYQQRPEDGPGEEAREWEWERECEQLGRPVESCSEEMSWRSSLISDRSWATAELAGGGSGGACSSGGWMAGASDIVRSLVRRQLEQSEQESTPYIIFPL